MQVIHQSKPIKSVSNIRTKHKPHMGISPHHILLLLFLLGCASLALAGTVPRIPDSAFAVEQSESTPVVLSDEANLSVVFSSDSVNLTVKPTDEGQFGRADMTIKVSTNNPTGYILTMTADATSLTRSNTVNGETPTIPTLTSSITCSDETSTTCDAFPNNHWGYKIANNDMTYLPMSTATTPIQITNTSANANSTTLYFATKLDNKIPSGTYENVNLMFVAVTNYVPEITYMQEMDQAVASAMTAGIQYHLKDSRDGKNYQIAKMSDGTVWMTQDLAFTGTNLTTADSNVNKTTTLTWYNLATDGADGGQCDSTNGYNNACTSTTTRGTYYNYAAASAMTVVGPERPQTGSSYSQYSLCPKQWRMITSNGSDYLSSIRDELALFSPSASGGLMYPGGGLDTDGVAHYWTRQISDTTNMYFIRIRTNSLSGSNGNRTRGAFIRCVFTGQ